MAAQFRDLPGDVLKHLLELELFDNSSHVLRRLNLRRTGGEAYSAAFKLNLALGTEEFMDEILATATNSFADTKLAYLRSVKGAKGQKKKNQPGDNSPTLSFCLLIPGPTVGRT